MLPGPGPLNSQQQGPDDPASRRVASRMLFIRFLLVIMLVSALTSRRRLPQHPKVEEAGEVGLSSFVPQWCIADSRLRSAAPTPIIYQGREGWDMRHLELAAAASARPGKVEVLWLGDGVTEGWRGTSLIDDSNSEHLTATKKLWEESFGDDGLALGIAGDLPHHLHWRLQHGELPWSTAQVATPLGVPEAFGPPGGLLKPSVCIVQIGGSVNIGSDGGVEVASTVEDSLEGILNLLCYLFYRLPSSQIIVMALPSTQGTPRDLAYHKINQQVNETMHKSKVRGGLHFVDCWGPWLRQQSSKAADRPSNRPWLLELCPKQGGGALRRW